MRKKTVNHIADTIFWYVLYFLPVLLFLIMNFKAFSGEYAGQWFVDGDLASFMPIYGLDAILDAFGIYYDSIIMTALSDIFSVDGLVPFFDTYSVVIKYFSYFVGVYLMHIMVDFILFIPRLAHKWMNSFTRSE